VTCPSERALGIAHTDGATPELRGHLAGCSGCAARWDELAQLRGLARALPVPALEDDERAAIRAALVAGAAETPPRRRRWPWVAAGGVGLAAAAAAATLLLARAAPPPPSHASVRALPGTLFAREGSLADEVLRLHDGALTLDVEPLHAGERFRVTTADAEVEVHGTSFQVIADGDRLIAVWVARGVVEVRPRGAQPATLHAGDSWSNPLARSGGTPPPPVPVAAAPAAPPPAPAAAAAPATAAAPPRLHAVDPAGVRRAASPPERRASSPAPAPSPPPALAAAGPLDPGPGAPAEATPTERAFDEGFEALRGGDAARAASAFDRAERGGGALAEDATFWRAVALRRAGQPSQALDAFAAFLSRYPASPRAGEAAVAAGWLALDAGRLDDAAGYFEKGSSDPDASVRAGAAEGLRSVAARR
jgi:TolA-binding protein